MRRYLVVSFFICTFAANLVFVPIKQFFITKSTLYMKKIFLASHLLALCWEACTADCMSFPSKTESLILNYWKGGPTQ